MENQLQLSWQEEMQNPAQAPLTIKEVQLISLNGNKVEVNPTRVGFQEMHIVIPELTNGIYILSMNTNKGKLSKKILIME